MPYRVVKFRRRREHKTDYKARLSLLKSGMNRLVVRKTNKYIIMQIIGSKEAQDFILCSANSAELLKHGWPDSAKGSLKSIPAAYLTGYLLGVKIKNQKIEEAISDTGLIRSTKGSRVYAAIKGAIDAGVKVSCSEDIMPVKDRLYGKNMKNPVDVEKIKSAIK